MNKKCCGGGCMSELDNLPEDYVGELDDLLDEDEDFELELINIEDEEVNSRESDHEKVAAILDECKELLLIKGLEYNSGNIKMGDYYPRGVLSVIEVMNAKLLKIFSLLASPTATAEEIEGAALNLINYTGIFIGVSRGLINTPKSKS